MAGNDSSSNNGKKKGFAGLSSMVSDVDAVIAEAAKPAPGTSRPSIDNSDNAPPRAEPRPAPREPNHNPPESTGVSSETKILIGFVGVVALFIAIIAVRGDRRPTSASQSPDSTYTPSPTTVTQPAPRPAAAIRPTEQKPPVGRNNVLAGAQLRYCVAEQIRVDAAEKVVDNYIEGHVDHFNAMVGDYNSRCGEFRYREGSLQSAERAMESYRAQLEQEGHGRILGSEITGSTQSIDGQFVPDVQPQKPPPDPVVRAIQRRLNQLGYNAGTPDGFSGQRTVDAIQKFQRDRGFSQDGKPTELLLVQLNDTQHRPVAATLEPSPNSSTTSTRPTAQSPQVSNPQVQISNLSSPERQSLESVCSTAKYTEGPAAYSRCVDRQLASLQGQSPRPSLAALTQPERTSIESACSSAKYTEGPAAYNRCLIAQLRAREVQGGRPDLSRLSGAERTSIESACSSAKYTEGPAAYNLCLASQLDSLANQGGRPSLAGLSEAERVSIESACSSAKYTEGPASYNRCLTSQLSALSRLPQRANLTNLTATQRRSIESACSSDKYTEGPAAYNTCLLRQLAQL